MTATQQVHDDLSNRLGFHPATAVTGPQHDQVRTRVAELAHWLVDVIPAGRHSALAMTSLQEALLWANAAIACDTVPVQPPVQVDPPG